MMPMVKKTKTKSTTKMMITGKKTSRLQEQVIVEMKIKWSSKVMKENQRWNKITTSMNLSLLTMVKKIC